MGIYLSSKDFSALEAASRAMLSSLAVDSFDDWSRDVLGSLKDLFQADTALIIHTLGETRAFCEEERELAEALGSLLRSSPDAARDPARALFGAAARTRKSGSEQVIVMDFERLHTRASLRDLIESITAPGVVRRHGISRCAGLVAGPPEYSVAMFVLFERADAIRSVSRCESLLRLLLPAMESGIETLVRRKAQRKILDLVVDPVIVMGPDRKEIHRNPAVCRLLDADPERDVLIREVGRTASAICFNGFVADPRTDGVESSPFIRRAVTAKGEYELVGHLLPAGTFAGDKTVMVSITKQGLPELPAADALRGRFGLTRREAEVALHLAGGSSNTEIANALCLSPHTARRHTANVYDKLGIRSRKGLALTLLSRQ